MDSEGGVGAVGVSALVFSRYKLPFSPQPERAAISRATSKVFFIRKSLCVQNKLECNYMNETEFLEKSEELFSEIEDTIDASGEDIESLRTGNVLTLETEVGEEVVLNLHEPTQEVWVASRAGGSRFLYSEGKWISCRDRKTEITAELNRALNYVGVKNAIFH